MTTVLSDRCTENFMRPFTEGNECNNMHTIVGKIPSYNCVLTQDLCLFFMFFVIDSRKSTSKPVTLFWESFPV